MSASLAATAKLCMLSYK